MPVRERGAQLITVVGSSYGNVNAALTAWTKAAGGCWSPAVLPGQPAMPFTSEVGYNSSTGANLEDHHVEGDGASPTGIYNFGSVMYGVSTVSPTRTYEYHHLVCGDWWDEQPSSPTYNTYQYVPCGQTPPFAGDSELLWTETQAYQHFAVTNFNPPPTNNPIGSGIFLHDDTSTGHTAGCFGFHPANWTPCSAG